VGNLLQRALYEVTGQHKLWRLTDGDAWKLRKNRV